MGWGAALEPLELSEAATVLLRELPLAPPLVEELAPLLALNELPEPQLQMPWAGSHVAGAQAASPAHPPLASQNGAPGCAVALQYPLAQLPSTEQGAQMAAPLVPVVLLADVLALVAAVVEPPCELAVLPALVPVDKAAVEELPGDEPGEVAAPEVVATNEVDPPPLPSPPVDPPAPPEHAARSVQPNSTRRRPDLVVPINPLPCMSGLGRVRIILPRTVDVLRR